MADADLVDFQKFLPLGSPEALSIEGVATVASAIAQSAPTSYMTVVSGTAELTTIALPWVGFAGTICFIPTGAFTGATGGTSSTTVGAIGKAFTAVAAKALYLTYLPSTGLWYPSY